MKSKADRASSYFNQARVAIIIGVLYLVLLFLAPERDGWIYASAAGTILVMGAAARGHYRLSQESQPKTTELRWYYLAAVIGFLTAVAAAVGRNIT
ncbi:UNVERIFIED_CONTAM: hypothetical protein Q9R71_35445 [Actinomycetes bacterium ARC8]|nr:hypothetical protein [Actinomycetes bacterium ARC8]